MADVQAVLSALDVLNQASDKTSFERANAWLQDFQHSPDAWSTCNILLLSQDSPPVAKLFAAQTFRAKVTFDLSQVDVSHLPSLRDSLVTALERFASGPKTIVTQLCLALSGLALQYPAWKDAVQNMIDTFGRNPLTVPNLLEFLTLLPEEINGNTKIPVSNNEYKERAAHLLTENARKVLDLLQMYISAAGVTSAIQAQVFNCLRSWLVAGEINASDLAETSLFGYAFEALASEALFDTAVDVICDTIHETQEVEDNTSVIQLIIQKLISIKPKVASASDDVDKMRGYARIFSEAGEVYRMLILQHPEPFFPIVEAIGECSAYPDLDIVPITFPFWMRLAQIIGKKPSVSPLLIEAYKTLMDVVIRHLHFPEDSSSMTSQEAEDFRSFRHVMGDTLKDCCHVLGTETCLITVYEMITSALARGTTGSTTVSWQEIEAPLFSLRSLGAEMDPLDDQVIPKIMDIIPSLPDHPRVRYAAILVISRYTEWTNLHPTYIPFQLQFISAGFDSPDGEVSAAAGQAMKYLCQDCKRHMVPYLPQLHSFITSAGLKLAQEDRMLVYEAVAYIISAMPMEQAAQSLRTFSVDVLSKVHVVTTKPTIATKQELREVSDALENLEVMLHIIQGFGEELPSVCQNTCEEAWAVFDPFLSKYGSQYDISERTTRVIRHGLKLFGPAARSVVLSVLARMSLAFEATGFSSYLWIAGKVVSTFGDDEDPTLRAGFKDMFERSTSKVVSILQEKSPRDIPDVMEDYVQLLLQMVDFAPDILFESSAFSLSIRATIAALTMIHSDIIFASLDLIRIILTHDSLQNGTVMPPKFPIYASTIRQVFDMEGPQLLGYLLAGLVGDFPEESTSTVVSIFRGVASVWPNQLLAWLPQVLEQLPTTSSPTFALARKQFLDDVTSAVKKGEIDKVKHAVIALHRFSVKTRERRRTTPIDREG
ncbi:ARM repeat-containing protein [Rickenella mellea]|uniref:ARM repeat-containing protein n=1 Tax=Rickenella mellea TaxID=50990 RepID=A0A4Y7QM81_9AGAM|nr:ARM repeat-containing protein [Rickenella mellea]